MDVEKFSICRNSILLDWEYNKRKKLSKNLCLFQIVATYLCDIYSRELFCISMWMENSEGSWDKYNNAFSIDIYEYDPT